MTLSHSDKMIICNQWVEYLKKQKQPVHIEELREYVELQSTRGKISYVDFYELRNFFNYKFKNIVQYLKSEKTYQLKKMELDEEEAKNLV